ncbi:hypothetical protein [Streptomyces sp. ADI93-02]|uniref:hypothetical protein n=1 Tax=Streptomyces sp. ADI93-02 TaxID=1522757 RepID=UPI000F554EC4|nr:hypothetical protein [Streptomyces sp. ADI93-02]WSS59817.1 DUF4158 domain-containing protein [Streptomyces sp. NBC_01177]
MGIQASYERRGGRSPQQISLLGRAWMHAEVPVALFDQAVGRLRRNRVLLPGLSVPARQVSGVRTIAEAAVRNCGQGG